ncbi:MAG: hypothetical protein KDD55_08250 [Bdellovibrionales bacterium]|nr:hypothetical protein [Bdellovibrionales bacterium]
MTTVKSRLTLTFLFYAVLALIWFLFGPKNASAERQRHLFYHPTSFQSLIYESKRISRAHLPRLEAISPFQLSFRARRIGRVTLRFSTRWNKRWSSSTGNISTRTEDAQQVILLRGSAQYRDRKNKTRIQMPVAAVLSSTPDGRFTFRATLRSPRQRVSYELTSSLEPNFSRHTKVRVQEVPLRSLEEAACAAIQQGGVKDENLSPSPHQRLEGDILVELTTIADGEFSALYGPDTNAVIAGIVNAVNVFYHDELGLELEISAQHTFDESSDPYSSTLDSETLLDDFTYIHPPLDFFGPSDIFHLFTGRDMNSGVIGIAWVGHVCDPLQNTSISQYVESDASQAVLLAHEIGHNFGAHHDTPLDGYEHIMRPVINPNATTFSSRSKHDIADHIATRTCIDGGGDSGTPTPTPTPSPTPSPTPTPEPTPGDTPTITPTPTPYPLPTTPQEMTTLLQESRNLLKAWGKSIGTVEAASTLTPLLDEYRLLFSSALDSPWFSQRQKKRIRRAERSLTKLLTQKKFGKKFKARLKRSQKKLRLALRLFLLP